MARAGLIKARNSVIRASAGVKDVAAKAASAISGSAPGWRFQQDASGWEPLRCAGASPGCEIDSEYAVRRGAV
jgi:hypothetical protein